MLKFVVTTLEYEEEAINFIDEFKKYNSAINGTGGLDKIDNYSEWVEKTSDSSKGINLKPGYVPASVFFVIRETDNKIVGMINIRHELNEYLLQQGGHIGYCVRPTERKKGYATETLYMGLKKCKEIGINNVLVTCDKEIGINNVLVTCDKENLGSAKTIQNNYGIFESEFFDENEKNIIQRYWIDVDYAVSNKKNRQ